MLDRLATYFGFSGEFNVGNAALFLLVAAVTATVTFVALSSVTSKTIAGVGAGVVASIAMSLVARQRR